MASTNTQDTSKLRILMLHGYTQSGPLFELKTKALKKSLEKAFPPAPKPGHLSTYPGGIELYYPTAPLKLDSKDIPGYGSSSNDDQGEESPAAYGWWKRKGSAEPYLYDGLEGGLQSLATALQDHGPFHGVIGFSQGGAAAGMLAALLETGRREAFGECENGIEYPRSFVDAKTDAVVHPPLLFAVSYSGFGASAHERYRAFSQPKIVTPMCHFIGSVDTVVDEARSLRLVETCVGGRGKEGGVPRLVYHPGGHFLPSSQKPYVAALVNFIRDIVDHGERSGSQTKADEQETRAEDMDVPF